MSLFDSDFDFNLEFSKTEFKPVDICGLVLKMKSKKRLMFNLGRELKQLEALIKQPPKKDDCFKMLSVGGGFSSLAIIKYIAELEIIENMYVSTFRIGKNHFQELLRLQKKGKIKRASFITSSTQKKTDVKMSYKGKSYNYFEYIERVCQDLNWNIKVFDNHSKLILMKTSKNFYVVETSSNLNENPKMEQFSFENDEELFNWYEELFIELLK